MQEEADVYRKGVAKKFSALLKKNAERDRLAQKQSLAADSVRLGRVVLQKTGMHHTELWEDGQVFRDLHRSMQDLLAREEMLEQKRKDVVCPTCMVCLLDNRAS
jgi:hypothetical protein